MTSSSSLPFATKSAVGHSNVLYLEEFLRPCAWCRKLHLDNEWVPVEEFLQRKFDSRTSHGICPACKADLQKAQAVRRGG